MPQKAFRSLVTFFVTILHVVAIIQFQLSIPTLPLPHEWKGQFLFLLSISLFLALLLPFSKSKLITWLLLGSRVLLIIVIGLPMDGYLNLELTLTTVLIIEAFEYLPLRSGICFATALIGVIIGVQFLPITAWGVVMRTPAKNDLWSYGIYSTIITVLGIVIRLQRDAQIPAASIKKNYQEALLQLGQVNLQLQEYAATVEQETLLNERKRLAREIHDTLAYTLTNLTMMLEAAKLMVSKDEKVLYEHLERARSQAGEGLTEVQRALQALRPVQLSGVTGLLAVQHLVNTIAKATQVKIELDLGNAPLYFGDEADLVAYRFVQEGITNALRHGHATGISISFSLIGNMVHILIKDNGIGVDEPKEGYGLAGMRERIGRLGGMLEISSNSGFGFRLLARIPIKGVAHGEN
ncbi:MAG: sensor histidine kinase [Bacteroidota bacterium]